MVRPYSPPQYQQSRFNCPRCGAYASHEWRELLYQDPNGTFDELWDRDKRTLINPFEGTEERTGIAWSASLCVGCEEHSLWLGARLMFPSEVEVEAFEVQGPSEDLPPRVADLYREAVAVLPHSRRAAAALCRAALEALAKELTANMPLDLKLDGRLVALADRLPEHTSLALQVIRNVGNKALHGASGGDESVAIYLDGSDGEIAEMFFVAINDLAYELITRPKRIREAYDRLPEGVRKNFEGKVKARGEVGQQSDRIEQSPGGV